MAKIPGGCTDDSMVVVALSTTSTQGLTGLNSILANNTSESYSGPSSYSTEIFLKVFELI